MIKNKPLSGNIGGREEIAMDILVSLEIPQQNNGSCEWA